MMMRALATFGREGCFVCREEMAERGEWPRGGTGFGCSIFLVQKLNSLPSLQKNQLSPLSSFQKNSPPCSPLFSFLPFKNQNLSSFPFFLFLLTPKISLLFCSLFPPFSILPFTTELLLFSLGFFLFFSLLCSLFSFFPTVFCSQLLSSLLPPKKKPGSC